MRKLLVISIASAMSYMGGAQNQYPTAKNSSVQIDGGAINMIRPATTGGWARGISYFNDQDNTRFGGMGLYGGGETPHYLYITHGQSPWNGNGIFVLPNGNTGIGVTSPSEKFHVQGRIYMGNHTSGAGAWYESPDGSDWFAGISPSSDNAWRIYRGNNKLLITPSGSVGIGTEAPGNWKLAVNGKIRAKEIKVETGWSDFVFEESYELPTLEEVEQYIRDKGHLKDIPSAAEVAENGVYLGEMDARLLQKIEELTLYILEQHKEIEGLKKRMELMEESKSR